MVRIRRTGTVIVATLTLFVEGFHVAVQRRPRPSSFYALKEPSIERVEPDTAHVENEHHHVASTNATLIDVEQHDEPVERYESVSRRDWLKFGTVLVAGTIIGTTTIERSFEKTLIDEPAVVGEKKLAPVNLTQAAKETTINVTVDYPRTFVSLDKTTFQKKRNVKLPSWIPAQLVPQPKVIRDITNTELLVSAVVAGSAVEMFRTTILYPLLTLKTRIQVDISTRQQTRRARLLERLDWLQEQKTDIDKERARLTKPTLRGRTWLETRKHNLDKKFEAIGKERASIQFELKEKARRLQLKRRLKVVGLNVKRHLREGQLYAGIVPSLVVSVPATGVYYGVRDVAKRTLVMMPALTDIEVAVLAALIADVISLAIRTPADALSIRRQVATGEESHDAETGKHTDSDAIVGNWFIESIERLPAIILTDLPFLLSRIAINRMLIQGNVHIGHYEAVAIASALLCGFLTTPFDVARTRILVDSDNDPTNGIDGGSGEGLIRTCKTIMNEGDGGVRNLFAGWLERTAYLGIGRAWLEPLQLLGYMWIRDAILLEWFD